MKRMRIALAFASTLSIAPAFAEEVLFIVCDNGLRCVRAPCPAQDAMEVATGAKHRRVSADFSKLGQADRERVAATSGTYHGTLVFSGTIGAGPRPRVTALRIAHDATPAQAAACRKRPGPTMR